MKNGGQALFHRFISPVQEGACPLFAFPRVCAFNFYVPLTESIHERPGSFIICTGDTGIGLAIVRKVAEACGGSVRAYNEGGACFEITLHDWPESA
jgi:hypothetical protein